MANLKKIDYFRAIWNYFLNTATRWSSGMPSPVNTVVTGPIHTVHKENGDPVSSVYWYEANYPEKLNPKNINSKYDGLRKFEKRVIQNVNKSRYQEKLVEVLVRYCRAFDLTDYEASFLKVWSIVERLTNTVGDRYDETIKRCSFLFEDKDYHKNILEHLRHQRNASVHSSQFSDESEETLYQIKMYADALISFHIFNNYRFLSMSEAGDFLSSTTDIDALKSRLNKTRYALRFLGYFDKNKNTQKDGGNK